MQILVCIQLSALPQSLPVAPYLARDDVATRVMARLRELLAQTQARTGFIFTGAAAGDGSITPFGHDTKVISSLFEMCCLPLMEQVASEFGLDLVEPSAQNHYPDFTLCRGLACQRKLAIDVKSTYVLSDSDKFSFTLGSFTSFIRPGKETKNITFPFPEYAAHLVIGFVYKRVALTRDARRAYWPAPGGSAPCGYTDVRFFVQEKWRIAGESAGAGDTFNIGSIRGRLEDFADPTPRFQDEAEYLRYWRNYGRTAADRLDFADLTQFRALGLAEDALPRDAAGGLLPLPASIHQSRQSAFW